jgi:hypothetical protein
MQVVNIHEQQVVVEKKDQA